NDEGDKEAERKEEEKNGWETETKGHDEEKESEGKSQSGDAGDERREEGVEILHDRGITLRSGRRLGNVPVAYATASMNSPLDDAITVEEALASPGWKAAMQDELDSLDKHRTWKLVDASTVPPNRVIPCKWVFKVKKNADGSIEKLKARVVAKGFRQIYGRDFTDTYAPVARASSVKLLFALAAAFGLTLSQYDVKTAYLYADLKEEIYMAPPPGLPNAAGKVCKLLRSLYGLKQAASEWHKLLTARLWSTGLRQSAYDPCLFFSSSAGGLLNLLVIHVDDLCVATADPSVDANIRRVLLEHFEMSHQRDPSSFLGISVRRDPGGITISQEGFISDILERFGVTFMRGVDTPAVPERLVAKLPEEERVEAPVMQQLVGCMTYLANGTRPDIAYAVQALSHFVLDPSINHLRAAKRVLRYLSSTRRAGIRYAAGVPNMVAYADADFAGDRDSRRSTSGIAILFAGGPLLARSKRQSTVALSTAEAELVALTDCAKEVQYFRNLLRELGLGPAAPTPILDDNSAAVEIANGGDYRGRMRHLDVGHRYVRELVQASAVSVSYIESKGQIADILTKPLTREQFLVLREKLSVAER
ncbi:MAG: reverse transcriptase domain-containing protein, partial [Bacteroidota bacterium]